ncbi:MAG: MMPL family transporter [Flavobacteriaceae bacterium]|nr:MMPL family transporter [Flavobacteriaceae bacterium]
MENTFYRLYKYISSKKLRSLVALLFLVAGMMFVVSKLQFEEDISKLIPASEDSKKLQKVLKSANFSDKLIVNIQLQPKGSFEDLSDYATQFIDSITATSNKYIAQIQGKVTDEDIIETIDFVYQNLPLFLDENDYRSIQNKITKDSIDAITNTNYKSILSPSGMITKNMIVKDPLGLSFIALKKLQALNIGDQFTIENGFVVSKDKKNILLFITPKLASSETNKNREFVDQLYKVQEKLNKTYKEKVRSEYFGGVIIAVANARQIKKDIQVTVSISLSVLMLILMVFYKKITIPIVLFAPTIIGGLLAGVFLFLVRDKISAISLGLGSVLLGITIDYSLHILTHLRNNNNVKALYKDVAQPILMSSLTTALAFLCLLFINSQALQDLGIFAAVSVLGSSVFALLFIPQVYKISEKKEKRTTILDKIARYNFHKSKLGLGVLFVILIVSFFTYNKVVFSKDLTKLNYMPPEMVASEENLDKLINFSSKSLYIATFSEDKDKALSLNDEVFTKLKVLKENDKIYNFSSIGALVFSEKIQQEKINLWNSFWDKDTKINTQNNLVESGTKLGFKPKTFQQFYTLLAKDFKPISLKEYQKIKTFLVSDYINAEQDFTTVTSLIKVKEENLQEVLGIFKNQENVLPIDRKQINETLLGNLKNDFNRLIIYSLLVVVLILFLFYRSLSLTLITSIPIMLTWLLTIGIMGVFKIEFNVFNIIISSFIFGLGIDYSIFMTNALRKDYTYGTKEVGTYKISIILSVITTVLGVGVLVFAKHPAVYSISMVSLIGILVTVFVVFTIQPLLFKTFISDRAKRGNSPIHFMLFMRSFLLTAFYAIGGMFFSLFSITILKLIPISKKKKYKWMHKIISRFVTQVLKNNYLTKKRVVNDVGETFRKPAIVIANHASSLDTLSMSSLAHNTIYLVNDWVYKSPIFGVLARVLGFYPVSTGVDGSVTHLKNKLNQGYMLCVFPEGKRSFTNKIGRFHKGAFFLQQQLKIDVLPIYIHGNSEVMPKGDFMIYSGAITVKVGERIAYNDINFGETDRERAKKISGLYKNNFLKFREEVEGIDYYKRILFSNYKFKEKELITMVSIDFEENKKRYFLLNKIVPIKSKILHIADDFGQIDILLVAKFLDRKITTFIHDKNKQAIAENCFTNLHRDVKYLSEFKEQLQLNFDTLLLTSKDCKSVINISEIEKFKEVIIVNNVYAAKKLETVGFVIVSENNNIVALKKPIKL